jgi:hypothetical protein
MTRRDSVTSEPFSEFSPADVVPRYSPERVRAASVAGRIARTVAEAIREFGHSREETAALMSEYLGETVTPQMLDQYSSTANEKHNIPAHRLIALLAVTSDVRIVNAALEGSTFIALDQVYEPLIRREIFKEAAADADAQWRAKR